jgi:hypothetical protein
MLCGCYSYTYIYHCLFLYSILSIFNFEIFPVFEEDLHASSTMAANLLADYADFTALLSIGNKFKASGES